MGSPLDFVNSDGFRKKLITKNLPAYNKSPKKYSPPLNYEYRQSDLSVIDSPDGLIDTTIFSEKLYPLNQYGSEGGYKIVGDVNKLNNTKANEGEYGFQDANIVSQSEVESKKWRSINVYGNGTERLIDSAEFFSSLDQPKTGGPSPANNQPYPSFNSSTYSPLSILLSKDPQGDNGLLSQDSFIARLGAQTLRKEFEQRIAANVKKETIGRANVFNVRSGTDILELATGRVPLIEPNWTITIPENPVVGAADFALKLAGSELPISPIPGSYFDPNINPKQPSTIQQLASAVFGKGNNFFNRLLGAGETGSDLMYANMGGGQKSRLFGNIDYNKYKPSFDRTLFDRLAGAIVGDTTDNANYYVGSITSNPSRVFSPGGDLPVDVTGREVQSPVYGPDELAKLYEGPDLSVKLGANGVPYVNGGGIEGGFTWVSPKYKENAGKKVGPGGQTMGDDNDFKPSSYNSTESTNQEYREGSILYDTQKLIDSQPLGGRRLKHVGNAIDQVSKVFNDGYKEITKGSKVLSYAFDYQTKTHIDTNIYCRVFAKDTPYLQYNDLQKTDGMTNEGRKFSYSVFDKTYNLNIVPNKQEGGQASSNLIGDVSADNSYAKKYMFSLENLAWRTSNTPGLTVADLPVCERGPNGGRVMWFPPYDLKFNENVSANWKANDFLGRPEPVYTYNNTSRSGTVSWKIVVDHPSVLNLIVNKVLEGETNKAKIDSILESFFAGCLKYDLYELAKKYYNVKPDDLRVIQKVLSEKEVTKEQITFVKNTIQNGSTGGDEPIKYTPIPNPFEGYKGTAFYFENDYPKNGGTLDFVSLLNSYTAQTNVEKYQKKSKTPQQVTSFFSSSVESNFSRINELTNKIDEQLTKYPKGVISIYLVASCSAPASVQYNNSLSQRRVQSAIEYFTNNEKLKRWVSEKRLVINQKAVGELSRSEPLQKDPQTGEFVVSQNFNCSPDNPNALGGDVTVGSKEVYTVGAMACRRTTIESITSTLEEPVTPPAPEPITEVVEQQIKKTVKVKEPVIEEKIINRNNITKFVVRQLLTECDYFETIKQDTPMVYDNLKQKLKFFQPAFHSITPEGLNSRLTFLQQCLRPGDTIPVVKEIDGATILEYNNATNTAFGSPPVLVLRVGDFYHTKIIPTSISFTYEDLDINPEGIGIQPMIANVSLQFNFVGGHGLKTSIDKLQNALSFNYYANTEMYDDRADVTDDSLKDLDAEFLKLITEPKPPTLNQGTSTPEKNNGNTIGTIVTKEIGEYETGTINYSDFMENLKKATETYFQTVTAKIKESVVNYNNAVRQVWMNERNYIRGNTQVGSMFDAPLFGKPAKIEDRFSSVTKQLEKDIKDNIEGFIQFISSPNKDFSERAIRVMKQNYIDYINKKSSFYQNQLTTITNDLVKEELSFVKMIGKANVVLYRSETFLLDGGTDGFQQTNGKVVIYNTSGTTQVSANPTSGATNTYQELAYDFIKIRDGMKNFLDAAQIPTEFKYSVDKIDYEGKLISDVNLDGLPNGDLLVLSNINDVFIPFSKKNEFQDKTFRRVYMLVSDEVTDEKKYETFKKAIIGNIEKSVVIINKGRDNFGEVFDAYWKNIALPLFKEEDDLTKEFIDHVEKNNLKTFLNFTPYEKKERIFTFTTQSTGEQELVEGQTNLIKGLGATKNPSSNVKTWNDSVGEFKAYTSKIKFG